MNDFIDGEPLAGEFPGGNLVTVGNDDVPFDMSENPCCAQREDDDLGGVEGLRPGLQRGVGVFQKCFRRRPAETPVVVERTELTLAGNDIRRRKGFAALQTLQRFCDRGRIEENPERVARNGIARSLQPAAHFGREAGTHHQDRCGLIEHCL